jgi:hypothetical protein
LGPIFNRSSDRTLFLLGLGQEGPMRGRQELQLEKDSANQTDPLVHHAQLFRVFSGTLPLRVGGRELEITETFRLQKINPKFDTRDGLP